MGYDQGYISGLELGRKGPPTTEFVSKLIKAMDLDENEQAALRQSVEESQRKYVLPGDAPTEIYRMVRKLWEELENLESAQIRAITEILSFDGKKNLAPQARNGRVSTNKPNREVKM